VYLDLGVEEEGESGREIVERGWNLRELCRRSRQRDDVDASSLNPDLRGTIGGFVKKKRRKKGEPSIPRLIRGV
jgi:hypothetical protein